MKEVINLTPHEVVVRVSEEDEVIFKPSGVVARVTNTFEKVGSVGGIPIEKTTFGEVQGLPEEKEGVYLIVSAMVRMAGIEEGRSDLLSPNTGKAFRNEEGHIVSVPGFVK